MGGKQFVFQLGEKKRSPKNQQYYFGERRGINEEKVTLSSGPFVNEEGLADFSSFSH